MNLAFRPFDSHVESAVAPAANVPSTTTPLGRLAAVTVIAAFVVLAMWCGAGAEQDPGELEGYLCLAGEGTPVAGVDVEVDGHTMVSDAGGVFRFRLPQGRHVLTLRREGAALAKITVPVIRGETTEIIITLGRHGEMRDVQIEAAEHAREGARPGTAEIGGSRGVLSGRVVEVENGSPVVGARIFLRGLAVEALTDVEGHFSVEVPIGAVAFSVIHTNYITQTLEEVEVRRGEEVVLAIEMTPSSVELDEFSVVAYRIEGGIAALIEERRLSSSVIDVIGAEQIAKSGDSDAASALKRVTGLTVVDGRYVYVRGMGERYSSSLLNRSSLPSPEPERRVVPLNLFPVDVIESVSIRKTYSPDMPGEFGGGAVILRTRGIPESVLAKVSFSTGYVADTSFAERFTYEGGDDDFFGHDDGTRALPEYVKRASDRQKIFPTNPFFPDEGFTPEELEAMGESMPNIWTPHSRRVRPNLGFSTTFGNKGKLLGLPAGFLFGFTFDNSFDFTEDRRLTYYNASGEHGIVSSHDYRIDTLENEINLGGILDTGLEFSDNHRLQLTSLAVRTTENTTRSYEGYFADEDILIRVNTLRWVEQMLLSQQVNGTHLFPMLNGLGIDWAYAYSMATRDEPDRRETRFDAYGDGLWKLSDRPEGNQRLYSELTDNNHDMRLETAMPFRVWQGLDLKVRAGGNVVLRDRESDTRRFKFMHKGPMSNDPEILTLTAEEIFMPEHIGPDGFQLEEITLNTDAYSADQTIYAAFLMADIPITAGISLSGGCRLEKSHQEVETFEIFNPEAEPEVADHEKTDYLPAATLTWRFLKNMQVRAGFSQTLSRPDFRELSPAVFIDVVGGRQIRGNPSLKRTMITNYDIRWEWYPSASEELSLGFFYKDFEDPIEMVLKAGTIQTTTFENVVGATNMGVELAFRKHFGFISKSLLDLYMAGNVAYIDSSVELGNLQGIMTSGDRPLQGQSPFVVNCTLGYDNADTRTSLGVLYNVFGERIAEVGLQGLPDIYEQPFHQLDFVASQYIGWGWTVKFKAKNLLDGKSEINQGSEVTESWKKGREFGLSFSWSH